MSISTSSFQIESIYNALAKDGAVIVDGVISSQNLNTILEDISGSFVPYTKESIFALKPGCIEISPELINKSKTYVSSQVMNDKLYELATKFLNSKCEAYWGEEKKFHVTYPTLSSAYALKKLTGFKAQAIHRADSINLIPHQAATHWDGLKKEAEFRECLLTIYLAADADTEFEVIPGSHLWDDDQKPVGAIKVYLRKGEALVMLGSTYYAFAANEAKPATIVVTSFSKGIFRQEQNLYLTVPLKVLRAYGIEVAKRVGYELGNPFLGTINLRDPLEFIFQSEKPLTSYKDLN